MRVHYVSVPRRDGVTVRAISGLDGSVVATAFAATEAAALAAVMEHVHLLISFGC